MQWRRRDCRQLAEHERSASEPGEHARVLLLFLFGGDHVVTAHREAMDGTGEFLDVELIVQSGLQVLLELISGQIPFSPVRLGLGLGRTWSSWSSASMSSDVPLKMAEGTLVMFLISASTRNEGWNEMATSTLAGESSLASSRDWRWRQGAVIGERRLLATHVSASPAEPDGDDSATDRVSVTPRPCHS